MPAILADHDIEGQLKVLLSIWTSPDWIDLWQMLDCHVHTFLSLAISKEMPDSELWALCQQEQFLLLTGNRNAKGEHSLEIASQRLNQPQSLPVFTIAGADRVMTDRSYAERIASRILDYLVDIDNLRGTRRLFVP